MLWWAVGVKVKAVPDGKTYGFSWCGPALPSSHSAAAESVSPTAGQVRKDGCDPWFQRLFASTGIANAYRQVRLVIQLQSRCRTGYAAFLRLERCRFSFVGKSPPTSREPPSGS